NRSAGDTRRIRSKTNRKRLCISKRLDCRREPELESKVCTSRLRKGKPVRKEHCSVRVEVNRNRPAAKHRNTNIHKPPPFNADWFSPEKPLARSEQPHPAEGSRWLAGPLANTLGGPAYAKRQEDGSPAG